MSNAPNILLICCDQLRSDALGVNGSAVCRTTNLDRLAAEGMNFSRSFTVSALCSPARASLLTGLYPHRHGMTDNCNARNVERREMPRDLPAFARILQAAGYRTGYVGKWHAGQEQTPLDWGFDEYLPGEGWHEWWPEGIELKKPSRIKLPYAPEKPMAARVPLPVEQYPDYQRASAAIDMLERYAVGEEPFLLRLDFFGPHYPHYLPEPYASLYEPAQIRPWANFADPLVDGHAGAQWLKRRWGVPDWDACAEIAAAYYGHTTCIDYLTGRVLDALSRLGLDEATMVVFTADHGDMTGAHGLLQKGAVGYDELYRIPLIVRWLGSIEAGAECGAMVELVDLMPTLVEVGGAVAPADLDGRSLVPLLRGGHPRDWREEVFAEYLGSQNGDIPLRILRSEQHKLVCGAAGPLEFFNLGKDPGELENRVGDPAHEDVIRDLSGLMDSKCSYPR